MTLSDYMNKHGISRLEMARRLGVTTEAVRLWLAGRRIPQPKHIKDIAAVTRGRVKLRDFVDEYGASLTATKS